MESRLQQITAKYSVLDYQHDAIASMLDEMPELADRLLSAIPHIENIFGTVEKPRVTYRNPGDTLLVEIVVTEEAAEVVAREEIFDEDWYVDQPLWFRRKVLYDLTWL